MFIFNFFLLGIFYESINANFLFEDDFKIGDDDETQKLLTLNALFFIYS